MDTEEMLVRLMADVRMLLFQMILVASVTVLALLPLRVLASRLWVGQRRFRILGLFYCLEGAGCVRLALAWIRFLLLLSFLLTMQKLELIHYFLFFTAGLLYALYPAQLLRIPARLLWLFLEGLALLSCSLIAGYIREMNADARFVLTYIMMALFTVLLGIYLFLMDVGDISEGRVSDLDRKRGKAGAGEGLQVPEAETAEEEELAGAKA